MRLTFDILRRLHSWTGKGKYFHAVGNTIIGKYCGLLCDVFVIFNFSLDYLQKFRIWTRWRRPAKLPITMWNPGALLVWFHWHTFKMALSYRLANLSDSITVLIVESAFKQQRLPAWQPILTAGTVLPTFFVIGIAFIPVGIGLLYFSDEVRPSVFLITCHITHHLSKTLPAFMTLITIITMAKVFRKFK